MTITAKWRRAEQQEDEVRDNLNQFVEPILRGTIYASCGLMDRIPDTPATAERNELIGTILNDRMIKVEAKLNEYDAARVIVVKEVAALKQSSAAASFEREEIRIRLNPPNQTEWEQINQSQKENLPGSISRKLTPNIKLNEVEISLSDREDP